MKLRLALALAPLCLLTCKAGAVGEIIEPDKPAAGEAMGELSCDLEQERAEPLSVDWPSADRTDLEVAMRDGLVVVAYDCERLRVLDSCRVHGGYSFAGVSRKEEMVQITGQGELHANLPVGKVKLSAVIDRGSTIDIALVTVGKHRTPAYQVTQAELEGDCAGATHFVKSALVGAFAMGTGTRGHVGTVAEVFKIGEIGGSSSSEHQSLDRDGDLQACAASNPSDPSPPAQCQSLLRVELVALREQAEQGGGGGQTAQATPLDQVCPNGFVREGAKCSAVASASGFRCDPKDQAQCEAQCGAGNFESCHNLAYQVRRDDRPRSEELFGRACDAGVTDSCAALAYMVDWKTQPERGATLLQRACDGGDGVACRALGRPLLDEQPFGHDPARAIQLLARAMELGDRYASGVLAWEYLANRRHDDARDVLDRDCGQGNGQACSLLGGLLSRCEDGRAPGMVPRDVATCEKFPKPDTVGATVAFERACRDGFVGACVNAGKRYADGRGVTQDVPRAVELLELGCPKGRGACEELGRRYEHGDGVPKDLERAYATYNAACQHNQKTECWHAARVAGVLGHDTDRRARLEQGCEKNSKQACDELTVALEKEGKTDAAKAIYQDVCERMRNEVYCKAYVRLGGELEPGFKPFSRRKDARPDDF
ncbi:tetratricopeptide repeat protein [Enhygromyxa salina]|nr:SEL1-like repeat protein [Enhygromyxa salina]